MSTLTSVINIIKNSISGGKLNPVKILPAPLLLCVSLRRPGMSAMDITSEWITELSKENIPIGKNTDGTNNLIIASGYAMIKSIMRSIKMDSLVTVAGSPGSITFTGMGTNEGGPMVVKGANDGAFVIRGTIE